MSFYPITPPVRVEDLVNTDVSNASNNDTMVFKSSTGEWEKESDHLQIIEILKDDYDNLTEEEKNDPHIAYLITDITAIASDIDDSTTALDSTWSSSKVNTELGKKENSPTILIDSLAAGDTSITFTNAAITVNSIIDVYVDTFGVAPSNITVSAGSAVLTFEAQSSAVGVRLIIK